MADFLDHHVGHHVGRGPHTLANLRASGEAAGKSNLDIPSLIGLNPARRFHGALADHGAGLHRSVHFIAGTIKETGVDENDPVAHRMDARRKIGGCPTFLIHHPNFHGVARKAIEILDSVKQVIGEGRFLGPMHFRLDDIDTAGTRVLEFAQAFEIVNGTQDGKHGIENAFRCFGSIGKKNCRIGHQVTNVAYE